MTCRKNQVATLLLVVFALLQLVAGCRKNTFSFRPYSNDLTVNVVGSDAYYPAMWIVVGSADGSSVLAVQRVEGPGPVEFGDVGGDPISVSIVCLDREGDAFIDSYLNTRGGAWTYVRGLQETIGTARVTLHFPRGYYDAYRIELPFGAAVEGWAYTLGDTATQLTATADLHRLEGNEQLSMFADLWVSSVHRYGWIVAQPFQRGQENAYAVEMDQTAQVRTIVATRPLTDLWLDAFRGSDCSKYELSSTAADVPGATSLDLVVPAFPADRWRLSGLGHTASDDYWYEWMGPALPMQLAIPSGSISASCNADEPRIEEISVSGQADAVVACFGFMEGSYLISWIVTAPIGTRSISVPVLPDSIREAIRFGALPLWTAGIEMDDYDTAPGYEGYMDIICRSDAAPECRYNVLYWIYRCLFVESSLLARPAPQPDRNLGRHARAFRRPVALQNLERVQQ